MHYTGYHTEWTAQGRWAFGHVAGQDRVAIALSLPQVRKFIRYVCNPRPA